MKSCAQYIAEAKARSGKATMSDREMGKQLGWSQQAIHAAKSGKMTDPLAIAIAKAAGYPPGEVIWVARVERERDPTVRRHLEAWTRDVGKALASVPSKVVSVLAALSMALGLLLPAHDVQTAGGEGRF